MATESRNEAITVIRKFVHGEITSSELLSYVRGRKLSYLDDLLERVQLRTSDYANIDLTPKRLCRRLGEFLDGVVGFVEISDWVDKLYRIHAYHEYRLSDFYSREIEMALLMLTLAVDVDLTESTQVSKKLIGIVQNALRRGHPIPSELILKKIYRAKRSLHLVVHQVEDSPDYPWKKRQWADLALLTALPPPEGWEEEDCWFIPISVCTRGFWEENHLYGPWAHPENDKMFQLRAAHPQVERKEFSPRYFVDPDGLVEVVLEMEELEPSAMEMAAKLFCLRNQVKKCSLDGKKIELIKEDR